MTIEEAQHIIDTTKSWTLKRDMQKFIKRERRRNGYKPSERQPQKKTLANKWASVA